MKRIVSYKTRKSLLKLAILIIGIFAFLPSHFLETDIESYEDSLKKDFAAYALEESAGIFNNTLEQSLIVSYEIASIEEVSGVPKSSVVIAYTAFGLPYAEVIVDESVAYINKKLLFQKQEKE